MCIAMPDFYPDFHCIAGACQHSCCKGWEIDIDATTLKEYQSVSGSIGEKLRRNIALEDEPHFVLDAEENCPFLQENHLCELILTLGESSLCQICRDHPRFYNALGTYEEVGLGLCCEEATRLLLSKTTPSFVRFKPENRKGLSSFQEHILQKRDRAFQILQNRQKPFLSRLQEILSEFMVQFTPFAPKTLYALLFSLEQMDTEWASYLSALQTAKLQEPHLPKAFEIPFEQMSFYFLYRYFIKAQDAKEIKAYLAFCAFSIYTIETLFTIQIEKTNGTMAELQNIVRLFSCEIEYSSENMDTILNLLWDMQSEEKRSKNVDSNG